MNGSELVGWLNGGPEAKRLGGAYLAGFLHGQLACESRVESFETKLNIPDDLNVPRLTEMVFEVSDANPEYLKLDIATFMYAVFQDCLAVQEDEI